MNTKKQKLSSSGHRQNFSGRSLLILVVVAVLVAAAVVAVMSAVKGSEERQAAKEPETSEQTKPEPTKEPTKPEPANDPEIDEEDPFGKKPKQYEGEDPNKLDELTGYINYSAMNGTNLDVTVTIDQFITSGTCTLTITQGATVKTYTAPVIANPSSASCEGFAVPLADLGGGGSGDWHIKLKVETDDKYGIMEGDVTL